MKLAKWQRNVIYVGLGCCLMAFLFPPALVPHETFSWDGSRLRSGSRDSGKVRVAREHVFALDVPSDARIDTGVLLLELGIIAAGSALTVAAGASIAGSARGVSQTRALAPLVTAFTRLAKRPAEADASAGTSKVGEWDGPSTHAHGEGEAAGMKLLITGGPDYQLTPEDRKALDDLHRERPITQVVSGGGTGAEACGEAWAKEHGIAVRVFHADAHGKTGAAVRNLKMVEYADAIALFPGGGDTVSMYAEAFREGRAIYDYRRDILVRLGFGARLRESLAWVLPLWMIFTLMPLLFGNVDTFGVRLVLGTPALFVLVMLYAAVRTGIGSRRRNKA